MINGLHTDGPRDVKYHYLVAHLLLLCTGIYKVAGLKLVLWTQPSILIAYRHASSKSAMIPFYIEPPNKLDMRRCSRLYAYLLYVNCH